MSRELVRRLRAGEQDITAIHKNDLERVRARIVRQIQRKFEDIRGLHDKIAADVTLREAIDAEITRRWRESVGGVLSKLTHGQPHMYQVFNTNDDQPESVGTFARTCGSEHCTPTAGGFITDDGEEFVVVLNDHANAFVRSRELQREPIPDTAAEAEPGKMTVRAAILQHIGCEKIPKGWRVRQAGKYEHMYIWSAYAFTQKYGDALCEPSGNGFVLADTTMYVVERGSADPARAEPDSLFSDLTRD